MNNPHGCGESRSKGFDSFPRGSRPASAITFTVSMDGLQEIPPDRFPAPRSRNEAGSGTTERQQGDLQLSSAFVV